MNTTIAEEFKNSGVPWIGEIPETWDVAMLKRTTYIKGRIGWQGLTTKEYMSEGQYLLVTGTDFENGRIAWSQCVCVDQERYDEDPYIQLKEDDILITKDGTIGKVAIVRGLPKPATLNSGVFVTRPIHGCYRPEFFYWVLISDIFPEFISSSMVATTINHLYQKTFERFIYPLPSKPEQERIVAYLNASCAAIDAAVAAKRRQLEALDALRRSTIQQVVTQGLNKNVQRYDSGIQWFGKIPTHWRCEHLKRFSERIQTGFTPPTAMPEYYIEGTIPWYAPGSYDGNLVLNQPRKLINELALHDGALRMFPTGTIFLIGIGATIGKVGLITEQASCNQQIVGIVCNDRMDSRYLCYQLKIYEEVIPGIAVATTLPIFDQVKTGYLPILQPPLEEQGAICDFIDTKLTEIKRLVESIHQQITTLLAYRKSLIHECVTGQRRVTNADVARVRGDKFVTAGPNQ
jgi:type I restriction enzyme S subunit